MKKTRVCLLFVIIGLIPVSGMEVSTLFHISDISFDKTDTAPVTDF